MSKLEQNIRKLFLVNEGPGARHLTNSHQKFDTNQYPPKPSEDRFSELHATNLHGSRFASHRTAAFGLMAISVCCAAACSRASAKTQSNGPAQPPPIHVDTQVVTERPVQTWLALTGQLKGSQETELAANASGRVLKTLVERGDSVKKGQPLAILDTRAAALTLSELRASAESARASAEVSKTNCERYSALFDKGAVNQAEFERISVGCRTSELGATAAQARAALAAQTLGDGVIRAPFAGSVAERYVDVGEYVRSDSKVATLIDLSSLRLEFTLPEADIRVATQGAPVRFTVAGYPEREFKGTLKYVGARVRPSTRDIVAEALVDSPDVALRPGMFASVHLAAGTAAKPVIPRRSLLDKDGRDIIFVVADGRLEERIVQTGETLEENVAIVRGVTAGEKVVIVPSDKLKNGQRTL